MNITQTADGFRGKQNFSYPEVYPYLQHHLHFLVVTTRLSITSIQIFPLCTLQMNILCVLLRAMTLQIVSICCTPKNIIEILTMLSIMFCLTTNIKYVEYCEHLLSLITVRIFLNGISIANLIDLMCVVDIVTHKHLVKHFQAYSHCQEYGYEHSWSAFIFLKLQMLSNI